MAADEPTSFDFCLLDKILQEFKGQKGAVIPILQRTQAEPETDHLEARPIHAGADYQDVLLAAAKRETMTHDFHEAMGERREDRVAEVSSA